MIRFSNSVSLNSSVMYPLSIELWMSIIMSSSKLLIGTYWSLLTLYDGWKTSNSHSPLFVGFVVIVTCLTYSFLTVFQTIGLDAISWAKNQHEFINTLNFLSNFVPFLQNFSARLPGSIDKFVIICVFIPSFKFFKN